MMAGKKDNQDKVGGDKISIGDISGSKGVAIGRGASVNISEGIDAAALAALFGQINQRLDTLPAANKQDVADAKLAVEQIKQEAAKGDKVDESALERQFRNIARMGPDILEVVTAMLVNPAAGVGLVVSKIAKKAREDAGLAKPA
jgi:translation elongation factor EF-4